MDDSKNNQNNNVFDESFCIKCCDLKSGREELSMVNKGFDKLIDKICSIGWLYLGRENAAILIG